MSMLISKAIKGIGDDADRQNINTARALARKYGKNKPSVHDSALSGN